MNKIITRNLLLITGVITGALAGYLYWKFVGCNSGACIISSKPLNSTVYGAVMGGLVFTLFKKENRKK